MDKGQHLRLWLSADLPSSGSTIAKTGVIALCTDFTFHCSASTEDSTTKDDGDSGEVWQKFEVMSRSYDIQVSALIGVGTDQGGFSLAEFMKLLNDSTIGWELAMASGTDNRTKGTSIATGQCKLVSINPSGQNRQNAVYSATFNGYGKITPATGS